MHPVDFGGHFGWLYEPGSQSNENAKSGIVICGPLGHEALWLHQTMRSLADRLADQGFAVLRFDYAGTGDSVETGKLVDMKTYGLYESASVKVGYHHVRRRFR